MTFSDRIKAARKRAGLTQGELAKKLGINQVSISDLERGKSASTSYAYQIAKICGVSPDWLVMGKGEMEAHNAIEDASAGYSGPAGTAETSRIPIVSYRMAGQIGESQDVLQGQNFDNWLPFRPPEAGPSTFAVEAEGESNSPRIMAGEIVIVDPGSDPSNDDFVVAKSKTDGRVILRRLSIAEGERFLRPGNPSWPEPTVKLGEEWIICGVVRWKYASLK